MLQTKSLAIIFILTGWILAIIAFSYGGFYIVLGLINLISALLWMGILYVEYKDKIRPTINKLIKELKEFKIEFK